MSITWKGVTDKERKSIRNLPPMEEHETKFPARAAQSAAAAQAEFREWQEHAPMMRIPENPQVKIVAVPPTVKNIARLAAVANSDAAPQELVNQKLDEETLFGTLYSTLTMYEYIRIQGEFKKRSSKSRTAAAADSDWQDAVDAAKEAFAAASLEVSETELEKWAKELAGHKENFEVAARIANSAEDAPASARAKSRALAFDSTPTASFVVATDTFNDPNPIRDSIRNFCSRQFIDSTYTQHWSRSWGFSTSIRYWCPTWRNWRRMCTKTVTLASVSLALGLEVRFRMNCCGVSAHGQAYARSCGTIAGASRCVGCTATVTGVAGFSRFANSKGECTYGFGVAAILRCEIFGSTVFGLNWSKGYQLTSGCPPPGFC